MLASPMVVVLMGLPGTGKSTLARALAAALNGVVLSKDDIRAAAFPEPVRDYSAEQDDLAMEMLYQAAESILRRFPGTPVILDGRTFTQEKHIVRVLAWAASVKTAKRFIECVCDDETARDRLAQHHASAANRNFDLYLRLKAEADPIRLDRLVIDTANENLQEAVNRATAYIRR